MGKRLMYSFYKAQGLGNDFIIFFDHDPFLNADFDYNRFSKKLAQRKISIGCDQVIFVQTKDQDIPRIRFFNADGSEAENCGNGTRCAAKLYMNKKNVDSVIFSSQGGDLSCTFNENGDIAVSSKKPVIKGDIPLIPQDVFLRPGVHVDVGNPHLVILDPIDDFLSFGENLENHPNFKNRTNVGFASILDTDHIELRVWERGTGPTLACGTAACAAATAAHHKGLCGQKIKVQQPGGALNIEIFEHTITQTGPADIIFKGTLL